MNIIKANQKYEAWLGARIPLLDDDLALKHQHMSEAAFAFLRATFFRWAQRWPEVSPKTAAASGFARRADSKPLICRQ